MDLKARLQALRSAAGVQAAPRRPAAPAAAQAADSETALARQLGAEVLAPGLLYCETSLEPGYLHGGHALGEVLAVGCTPLGVPVPPPAEGWLFFDTETTGLAGGSGTLVFLFGAVHLEGTRFRLRQWLLTRFAGEAGLMTAVQQAFDASALLVSFNGKSFDLPLLRTRQRMHGRPLRESHLVHLDLLHPARSAFAARWPDVRLQTAERRLCAVQRHDDLPGAAAPQAFADWLRAGESAPLIRIVQHHRDDVLSLVTLTAALAAAYRDPRSRDADEDGIVRRMRRRGYRVRAGQAQLALSD